MRFDERGERVQRKQEVTEIGAGKEEGKPVSVSNSFIITTL